MTYLVDANVICEPTKSRPSPQACRWLEVHDAEIVIDAVVLGEIWEGIFALPIGRKKQDLEHWFLKLRATLICLPWTADASVVWGKLRCDVRRQGYTVAIKDTMIAANAKLHDLIVATRNVADFRCCGVALVNPFEWQE